MRYLAIFTDIPDGAAIRAEWTQAHQAFLREHKGKLRLAAPCATSMAARHKVASGYSTP